MIQNFISKELAERGYQVDQEALNVIQLTNAWYTNKNIDGFHNVFTINGVKYNLEKTNFAKTICNDDANLVEVIEINAQNNDSQNEYVNDILKANNFTKMYRKQIEQISANGTAGAYLRFKDALVDDDNNVLSLGKIEIQYVDAQNIIPLKVVNDEVIEVAFASTQKIEGNKLIYSLIIFYLVGENYNADIVYFNERGQKIESMSETLQLGDVKPFAILRTATNNNLEMYGYGFPKLYNAIPSLKILDLATTMFKRDLDKSDKVVLINQRLAKRDENGNLVPPTKEMKKIFVQVGDEKLPQEGSLYQEYNPTIRVEEAEKSIELALSMLSMSFGYGTKRYEFENGRILTATEYIGDKQDMMQELNKQREENKTYISDIIKAIRWFVNNFEQGIALNDDEINVDFDDSYVIDREAEVKALREDALAFQIDELLIWYLMKRYNISEEEATKLTSQMPSKDDGTGDEE